MMGTIVEGPMARRRWRGIDRQLLTGIGVLALTVAAGAQEPPPLKKGLWEFTRTVEGTGQPKSTLSNKKCTSPADDMRQGRERGAKGGCQFSDVARTGNVYRYTATCPIQGGKITSKQILTAQSDSAYTIRIESDGVIGGQTVKTKEELVAKRLGDCP
jgi:hypothetical protein